MPDLADINSWPAAVVALALVVSLQIPGLISTVRTRRDTRAIRAQTENEHQDHPTPNLREQMDAQDERQERMATAIESLTAALTDHIASDEAWKTSVEDDLARRRRPLLSWRY